MPRERQKESFELLKKLITTEYAFKDRDEARDFFIRLTGIYKNYNYSAPDSPEYARYRQEIEELVATYAVGT